jgi:3-hydroxybutyrate dehydrogenase
MWPADMGLGAQPLVALAAMTPVVEVDLGGRTALVTGAGQGIGRACALRLAAAGAQVLVVDRDEAAAADVAKQATGTAFTVDLADLDAAESALGDHLDAGVDILVNNAGLQHVAPLQEFPPDRFAYIQRVMVEAPFRLVRRALPGMYARGWGRVVNISSVHGLRASPFKAAYVTAKHALEGLSKTLALEGAAHGVTSNCINPAYVRTQLVESQIEAQAAAHGLAPDEVISTIMLARAAIKRLIEPEEVAAAVLFLIGPGGGAFTGTPFLMDAGWTAR